MSQSFDINVLREEARSRWLKPSEVYYILQNHERFPITHEAPKKPPSGSLFLYNRRVNRYFRRDGHTWRRKKDGRTVGEAHERLKVGNVDALSCYYAHGEQNPCFQRRCFWMLEPAYEHIVLVQYREVAEGRYYSAQLSNGPPESLSSLGYRSAIYGNQYLSSTSGTSEGSESHQSYSNLSSVTEVSSYSDNKEYNKDGGSLLSIPELGQTCLEQTTEDRADNDNSKHKSGLNVALKKIAEQLSLGDDNDDEYIYSNEAQPLGFATNIEAAGDNQLKQIQPDGTQKGLGRNIAPSWEDVLHSSSGLPTPSIYQSDAQYQQNSEHHPPGSLDSSDLRIHLSAAKRFLLGPEASIDSPASNFMLRSKGNSGHDTLSAHDSRLESSLNPDWRAKAPLTFQSDSQGSEITELLFDHGQFEPYSRADTRLTSGQMKQFNIREISPEWAFSYEITKVIITGEFLCDPSNFCWAVMFGDSEVPVEIVQPGVLRCHTPLHSNGKFRVCITSGNREVCSDFKEFEFRSKHTSSTFSDLAPSSRPLKSSEELLFLAKFSRMLLSGNGNSEVPDGDFQSALFPKLRMNEELWDRLIDELKLGCENPLSTVDQIMEELLKTRLQQWLSVKLKGFNGTASSLSKHEQGIIHLISALGYEWALSSVLSVGVGLNFRDSNGWTALHWAAYFGREKMVAALLAAGASATAVTDPTAQDPVGKTAAFLASERGHTGLAGYLSEVSLTSYLASLTIEESDVSKGSAEVEAERAVESISQRSAQLHGGTEDELSMKDSLAAVRNAAQAAARIQNAFRAFSFRKRQEKTARLKDEYGMTQEDIDELAAASRLLHQSHTSSGQFYDKAAVSIQKKYKGWKGRKHFLNMRRNAVKIQAHVRGHQVRKKYRTIVSAVSVLEKVILRWRRKGRGLRGFRAEQQPMVGAVEDDEEEDDFYDDEAVRVFHRQKVDQAVKESVSRVLSMVDYTEARMQYRRMLEELCQATDSTTTELLFDQRVFKPYSKEDPVLTLGKQWFDIHHISPEWAFSYEITKVIFTGDFLCDPYKFHWAVMFGDCEVPAEIVQPGVLLCHTPLHRSAKLRVYIISLNREVCSEFKDFEIRVKPSTSSFTDLVSPSKPLRSGEELLILAKFARLLLSENGSTEVSDGDHQSIQCPKLRVNEELWQRLIDEMKQGCANPLSIIDQIMEELLKSDLHQWLSMKVKGSDGIDSYQSNGEDGILHLISALGYEWALSSVLSASVGINSCDSNGWTGLHWAAYFGRERMVAALLAAGASATAVTSPTAQDPVGKTAALVASEQGHMGLAGYLSEVPLTRNLDSFTIEENTDVSEGSAEVEAETAVEYISQRRAQLRGGTEDEFSMKDSLAAVRNAAQAASRIQNAFRAFSFRKRRQQKTTRLKDEYGTTQVEEPHSTPCKDVMAWIAMGKQRQKELSHTCMQKVGHKLLGRDDIRKNIMEKILLDRNGGSKCTVICINGGSGLGKTSLLRVLYNDQEFLDAFDKRIWIHMSDKYDVLMLFRKIIEFSMNEHCSITNIDLLQELVMEEIENKKFLLFLDDADIEDQQFWTSVLEVLNAGIKGSAVVMATGSSAGAAFRNVETNSFFLNPLSEENNLMLLQKYAFVATDIQTHPDLLMIAKRIITRFGSNPLNLKAIGGLLCHADSISLELDKFEGSVTPLQLCHDVLPIHMKKCLAFCSLFPKGYTFDKHHIVIQWISHGCVEPVEGRELEDDGVEYFNELLCRSFFQYSSVHNDKDDKFVVHELVYKVLESVSRDRYFKSEDLLSSIPENILHLSLVSPRFQAIDFMPKTEELTDLQTFMVVQPEWQPFPTLKLVGLDDFFLKFTSLEVLDLSHTDTAELPGSIGDLSNLQYLSVNNSNIRTLPSEVCSLSNLQTLQAKDCKFLTELPSDTKRLLKLRHLDVTKELDYVYLPHGIGNLNELRTLPVFHASSDPSHCSVSELGDLHNLRGCLWLSGLESVKTGSRALEANLKDKHHLNNLTLQWHDDGINIDDEDEDTETVSEQVLESLQPHTNLQELAIRGYEGSSFPAWMQSCSSLPNLVSLTLDGCCNCTQFPAITHLPSLKFLSVRKMYDVKQLSNSIHGATKFPSLELLNLWEMYGLEELFEASEGDCPRLRKVRISRCPDLKRLPCVHSLTELVLHCGGRQLPDIPELASLVSLKIEGFHVVTSFSLPVAAALPALKKLEIRSCKELSSVEGLSALTTPVRRLKVAGCPKLVLPSLVT